MGQRSSLTGLSLQPEETPGADKRPSERRGRTGLLIALLLLLIALGLGVGGYVMLRRVQTLEQQVATLSARAVDAEARAWQAANQAAASEAAARNAAAGRQAAETQTEEARIEADASRAKADVALQQAESAQATAARAQAEAAEIRKKAEAEITRLYDALGNVAETHRTALGLVMNLGGDHLKFEFNKAELRPEDKELLSRIAGILMTATGTSISVNGHTDDVGTDAYNQKLSETRARVVYDYLIKAGLSADILSVAGYGKSVPLVPGTSDAARAKNRRVELGIADSRLLPVRPGTRTP